MLVLVLVDVSMLLVAAVVVAVSVTVTIAVAVAVAVAVTARVVAGAVQDEGHVAVFLFVVQTVKLGEHRALEQTGADDEEGAVHIFVYDLGIGHDLDRGTVDYHVVVLRLQLSDKLSELRRFEQFSGIRGNGADGKDEEGVDFVIGHNEPVDVCLHAAEVIGESEFWRADILRHGAVTHVTVDDQHTLLLQGDGHAQVDGYERFAAAGIERGEGYGASAGNGVAQEFDVGAEHAEGFVDDVALAGLHHNQLAVVGVLLFLEGSVLGNLAGEGGGEVLYVLAAANAGVAEFLHGGESEGYHEADGEGYQQRLATVGGGGEAGGSGLVDDAGIVGGEGLRQFIFLALLQKEEVEGFLHFLLTLDAEQVLGLRGVGGELRDGVGLGAAHGGELGVEGGDFVVDAADDGLALGGELLVVLLHQGVGVGRFVGKVVALQQLAVVFAYHALDVAALQAGVGGQQLSVAGVGHEVRADVAGHGELVVELEDAGLRLLVLRHIHGGCGAYVGDEVGALVAGDVGVDVAELVLDDAEAVVDEVGGGDGYLVFVVYPVFVIYVYQCLEHVVGALGGLVGNGELYDGAVFSGHGHLQAGVV